ncbi:hypothetical protein AKJ51_01055 [candidate division MSBL1 archaeon SCGC-AAA382A20]|uniref:Uncharacterized protein n=1 Tax=candidate division MSBL1 archaeon SCGC-AAA382A20 TaxID=1698280 RepID=A0A133VMC7_9EURY|nr:hypothetical protein AKJ51_01055 [candidate division MSBL1 archaeon SCGC-AAA382A20]
MTEQKVKDEEEKFAVENIPGGVIKALSSFTESEKGRYALNCVHVDGQEAVAADGISLAIVNLPDSLGPEGLYDVKKPSLKKRKPVKLIRQNGRLKAIQSNGNGISSESYPAGEGTFPNYQEVIPPENENKAVVAGIDNLKKALNLLDCAGYEAAKITLPEKQDQPFRVDGYDKGKIGVTAVISPISNED